MSDLSPPDLAQRLDDLLKEVRRQGRAAIAAQAAAESCLAALREKADLSEPAEEEEYDDAAALVASDEGVRWLLALMPVADALERVTNQAAALSSVEQGSRKRRGLFDRLLRPPAPEPADGRAGAALQEGLRLLRAQLEAALCDLGVSVDRRTGGPVDGERQRVVELRRPRSGERRGTVVEVVRPGYALGARTVREAEVVVADGEGSTSEGRGA